MEEVFEKSRIKFTAPGRAKIQPSSGFVNALDQVEVIVSAIEGNDAQDERDKR